MAEGARPATLARGLGVELPVWLLVFCVGLGLIYLSTKNLFAYHLVAYWVLVPAIVSLPNEVLSVFALGALAKGLGVAAFSIAAGFRPARECRHLQFQLSTSRLPNRRTLIWTIGILMVGCVALLTLYFGTVGVAVLSADAGPARLANKDAPGGFFFMRLLRCLMPILTMMLFLVWDGRLDRRRGIALCLILSVDAMFLAFTGFKGNILMFLVIPALLFLGLTYRQYTFKFALVGGVTASVMAFVITGALEQTADLGAITNSLSARLTTGAFDGLSTIVLDVVPEDGLRYGSTFVDDVASLTYKLGLTADFRQNFSAQIANRLLGERYIGEQASNTVEGELYANFGITGVMLGLFVVGILLQAVYVSTIRGGKEITKLPFMVSLQLGLLMSLGGPMLSMTLDYTISIAAFWLLTVTTYSLLRLTSVDPAAQAIRPHLAHMKSPRNPAAFAVRQRCAHVLSRGGRVIP